MKKMTPNLRLPVLIGALFILLAGCSSDDGTPAPVSDLVGGTWTVSNVDLVYTVGAQSLKDYLVNVEGYTPAEADFAIAFLEVLLLDELDGTISFNANNTYNSNFGGSPDDGTWSLSADGKTLTLDAGTIDEEVVTINSLTSSNCNLTISMDELEDVDDDPSTPDVLIKIEATLTLTK
jgi:hypothetical protein